MNPSPLPQEQSAAVPPPLPSAGQKSHVLRNVLVGAVVLVGLVLGGLVASCPDEAQLRSALYGELGPKYKTILENAGVWARALHLPHLVYHNHVVYSTLGWTQAGTETRMASGMAGRVQLTPKVKEIKTMLLSVPVLRSKLSEKD